MSTSRSNISLVVPVLLIVVGIGWLLSTTGVLPSVNWIWSLGLLMIGALTLALGGLDKFTIVVGPFMLLCAVASVLRQTGRLDGNHEVPILVIVLGALMLLSRQMPLRAPSWWLEPVGRK